VRVLKGYKTAIVMLMLAGAATNANAGFAGTTWKHISASVTSTGPFALQGELPSPASSSLYGESVAMWHDDTSGIDWAVVGAPGENDEAGAAYVYSFTPGETDWKEEARLIASDSTEGSAFGYAVAIDHSTIAVGAPFHDADFFSGASYIFVRDEVTGEWEQQGDELNAGASNFGIAIALSGDTLAAGGSQEVDTYTRSNGAWSPLQTLTSTSTLPGSDFAESLAMSGDWLLVGAPLDSDVMLAQGAATLFSRGRDGWDIQQVLRPASTTEILFGTSVAISSDTIAVGAPASGAGTVHVFSYDGSSYWNEASIFSGGSTMPASEFGSSVALYGNTLVVGAPGVDSSEVFRNDTGTWTTDSTLTGDAATFFGWSVAVAGDKIIVGAPASSDGEAYAFVDTRPHHVRTPASR
jgi:FG-GAP repeat